MDKFLIKLPAKASKTAAVESVAQVLQETTDSHTDPAQGTSAAAPVVRSVSTKRRFVPTWIDSFPWIQYDTVKDIVLCSTCREIFLTMGLPFSSKKETVFIETGFNNWKKGVEKFKLHEKSACHQEAVMKMHAVKTSVNVVAQVIFQSFVFDRLS